MKLLDLQILLDYLLLVFTSLYVFRGVVAHLLLIDLAGLISQVWLFGKWLNRCCLRVFHSLWWLVCRSFLPLFWRPSDIEWHPIPIWRYRLRVTPLNGALPQTGTLLLLILVDVRESGCLNILLLLFLTLLTWRHVVKTTKSVLISGFFSSPLRLLFSML